MKGKEDERKVINVKWGNSRNVCLNEPQVEEMRFLISWIGWKCLHAAGLQFLF